MASQRMPNQCRPGIASLESQESQQREFLSSWDGIVRRFDLHDSIFYHRFNAAKSRAGCSAKGCRRMAGTKGSLRAAPKTETCHCQYAGFGHWSANKEGFEKRGCHFKS